MEQQRIFFSYAREDASDFALKLAGDLRSAGASIWIDQLDIKPSQRWDTEIQKALFLSNCILFIVSEASILSDNVLDEVNYALENKKQVIPLRLHDCKLPYRVSRLQYIDFSNGYEKGYSSLADILNLKSSVKLSADGAIESSDNDPSTTKRQENTVDKKKWRKAIFLFVIILVILVTVSVIYFSGLHSTDERAAKLDSSIATVAKSPSVPITNDSTAKLLLKEGQAFFNQNDFDNAILKFSQAIEKKPDYQIAYVKRGSAYMYALLVDKAFEDFAKAIQLKPDDPYVYYWRGIANRKLGKLPDALADFNLSVKFNFTYEPAYIFRGEVKEKMNDFEGALADYSKVIQINPKHASAYYYRAKVEVYKGRRNDACNDFKKSCDLGDSDGCNAFYTRCK